MKKLALVVLFATLITGFVRSQESQPIIGIWESSQKALEGDVEKTEYWIITESNMRWVNWKDNGTGTYDEVNALTKGMNLKISIEGNLIKIGDNGAMQIKILEVDDKTATLEIPMGKGTKEVKFKRLVK